MSDMMTFPATVEEFMEQYKIVDDEKVYTNGADLVPIFRMMQWFEHVSATDKNVGTSDDCISRQAAIDAIKDRYYKYGRFAKKDELIYALEGVPPAQLGTNLAEVGTDTISRQEAQRLFGKALTYKEQIGKLTWTTSEVKQWIADYIEDLPSAQPEPCEYAVQWKQLERYADWFCADVPYPEFVREAKAFIKSVTPKQRTGEWILDRSGGYCCSECMEPCAGYVMMKPRDKFCKMCGAKMTEGDAE